MMQPATRFDIAGRNHPGQLWRAFLRCTALYPAVDRFMTNSAVYGNYAAGLNNGLPTGFTSGGVNGGYVKNCRIHDNIFVDCYSIYYQDTGNSERIQILNNKLVRGWSGVGLGGIQPTWTKQDFTIAGNSINLQNRAANGGASYGIAIFDSASSNFSITGNYFSFTTTGQGYKNS